MEPTLGVQEARVGWRFQVMFPIKASLANALPVHISLD